MTITDGRAPAFIGVETIPINEIAKAKRWAFRFVKVCW
jgi:hypothetical protein